jgi:hypothetical protein
MGKSTKRVPAHCPPDVRRRQGLIVLAGLAGMLWADRSGTLRAAAPVVQAPWPVELAGLAGNDGARFVGRIYIDANPHEADPGQLLRLIGGDADPSLLALVRHIDRDWQSQDVAVIGGWVFARTEARICALAHLHCAAQ